MVASQQRIASAYFVVFGNYGDVSRYAQERGVCRQWVYREAEWVQEHLQETQQENHRLRQRVRELIQCQSDLEERLALAGGVGKGKKEEVGRVGRGNGGGWTK